MDWIFENLEHKTQLTRVKENINSAIVELSKIMYSTYMENMCIELPKPPSVTLESQMQDFNNYIQFVNDVLETVFADEVFDQESCRQKSKPAICATVKSRLITEYLSEKGILPELIDAVSLDENRDPDNENLDISISHICSQSVYIR